MTRRGVLVGALAAGMLVLGGQVSDISQADLVISVGTRLTRDQLIGQVSNGTPGGGNMPAYAKQISPAEMTALVDFLTSLRPPGAPSGRSSEADEVL